MESPELTLHLVSVRDAAEILAFELENRTFFAQSVPDRGDEYFLLPYLERFFAAIEAEQQRGESYLYLVRNRAGELVGRVNLTDIAQQEGVCAASIGYRIGARHAGRGFATRAVRLALDEAVRRHGIGQVRAMTTAANVGSQIVLQRNGFQFTERRAQALDVNGVLQDAVHFVWAAGAGA